VAREYLVDFLGRSVGEDVADLKALVPGEPLGEGRPVQLRVHLEERYRLVHRLHFVTAIIFGTPVWL
jgi:hypothetical protein